MDNLTAQVVEKLSREFKQKSPYSYVDMSGILEENVLKTCAAEIDSYIGSIPAEKNIYASYRKHKLSDLEKMPPKCQEVVSYFNSTEFIARLEQITGIEGLLPDQDLQGGGIHAIGRGGFLKIHTDFNWHSKLQLHRRLNLLVYLNENWQNGWGGAIEMWSPDMRNKLTAVAPQLGNVLLFATSDLSYHGHPDPLQCPDNVWRKSFAMYYYSATRPDEEVAFGKSEMTNYVERPGEKFTTDRLRRLRHRVQLALKRLTK